VDGGDPKTVETREDNSKVVPTTARTARTSQEEVVPGQRRRQASPRHQSDTKTFEELTAKEQALSINAHTVWYLKAFRAHRRRIGVQKATEEIASQLERMAVQVRNLS
jgi:hypothetical protein